jgi:hypothetical protein
MLNRLKTLFSNNTDDYTKWLPLGNYNHGSSDYIVFVRKDRKTNLLEFKTTEVTTERYSNNILPHNLIDTEKAWNEIINQ